MIPLFESLPTFLDVLLIDINYPHSIVTSSNRKNNKQTAVINS